MFMMNKVFWNQYICFYKFVFNCEKDFQNGDGDSEVNTDSRDNSVEQYQDNNELEFNSQKNVFSQFQH